MSPSKKLVQVSSILLGAILALAMLFPLTNLLATSSSRKSKKSRTKKLTHKELAQCLIKAYPSHLKSYKKGKIIWHDGTQMIFDDGRKKTFTQKIKKADIEDQLSQIYPLGTKAYNIPKKNFDPGRIRNQAFFLKMYGKTAHKVDRNLTWVTWMPKTVRKRFRVTRINQVNKRIERIGRAIERLPRRIRKYASKTAGTFIWRKIKGTQRLSSHSFGTAIDTDVRYANYWRWNKIWQYKNQIPRQIVEIFEKEGFIWGGKWYHYDTMHFEYRPELLTCR